MFFSIIAAYAHAKPGFQSITSSSGPRAIVQASQHVFEFWGPGNIQKVDRSKYLALEKRLATAKPKSFREKMVFKVAKAEIMRCRKLDLRTCSVSSEPSRGSAFFVEGGRLVTVAHNFALESALLPFFADLQERWNDRLATRDPQIAARVFDNIKEFSANPLKEAIFFVTDRDQNIVLSSVTQKYRLTNWRDSIFPKAAVEVSCAAPSDDCIVKQIKFDDRSTANPSPMLLEYQSFLNDVAILHHESTAGIPLASVPCTVGDEIFIVGYPAKTSNRKQSGFRDAADREIVFTEGVSIPVNELDQLSEWSGIQGLMGFFEGKNVLFSDADGWPGMSGGAILNRDGKVCGVFVGSSPMGGQLARHVHSARYNIFSFGVPLVK